MAVADTPDEEDLREALFGTYRRAILPPAVQVMAGLVVPLAAIWLGLTIGTVRTLAGKAKG